MHVLVVGQHGVRLGLEEVDVPDAQQGQQDRHVLVQRGAAEMIVLQTRDRKGPSQKGGGVSAAFRETWTGGLFYPRTETLEAAADQMLSINNLLPSSELPQEAARSSQSLKDRRVNENHSSHNASGVSTFDGVSAVRV